MNAMRPRAVGYNQANLSAALPCRPFCANAAPHNGSSLYKAPSAAAPQVRDPPQRVRGCTDALGVETHRHLGPL